MGMKKQPVNLYFALLGFFQPGRLFLLRRAAENILSMGIGYLRFSVELIMCVNLSLFQCQSNQPIRLVSHKQWNVQHIIVQL